MNSVAYCTHRQAELTKMIQESVQKGERLPPFIKDLNKKVFLIKGQIENGCRGGQITIDEYAKMLEDLNKKDQAIMQYLSPKKADPKVMAKIRTCMGRFKIVKAELAEIKAGM